MMPKKSGGKVSDASVKVNATGILPGKKSFYHYTGSLTTPPCSEGVRWFIMDNIVSLSESQLKAFTDIFKMNARPLQPINGRKIARGQ
jgi:carbonic anhydrase